MIIIIAFCAYTGAKMLDKAAAADAAIWAHVQHIKVTLFPLIERHVYLDIIDYV